MTIKTVTGVMTDDSYAAIVREPDPGELCESVVAMRARHENRVTNDQNDNDDAVPGH
jgi:hypothetical protein